MENVTFANNDWSWMGKRRKLSQIKIKIFPVGKVKGNFIKIYETERNERGKQINRKLYSSTSNRKGFPHLRSIL